MHGEAEKRNAHLEALARLGRSASAALPLDRGAALITANEQPWVDPDELVGRLDELSSGLHIPPESSTIEQVARLNHHLFEGLGFHGNEEDYDAPVNSLLDRVIEQRKGLPLLLSIIYIEVARRVGVEMDGVGFPGHFVVRPRHCDDLFFVDPFGRGRIRRPEEMLLRLSRVLDRPYHELENPEIFLEPLAPIDILCRMSRNLKVSYLRRRDATGALRAVDRILALRPEIAEERRDRGLLLLELERHEEALEELRRYLSEYPEEEDWSAMSQLVEHLESGN